MNLNNLYKIFKEDKESRWIMESQNVEILYRFIKKHPIKRVLDLGTGIGCTAAVVALALKDKGETDYHIDTVEQYNKCIKLAKKLIPEELQTNITFHKSEAVIWQTTYIPYQTFSVYETIPEGDYDLIINDGPSPFMKDGHFLDLPNATVTDMLIKEKLKPGTLILWDGRLHHLQLLEKYFSDNFLLVRPMQRGRDDLNILERKDNPVSFKDDLLANMRLSTYFEGLEESESKINR